MVEFPSTTLAGVQLLSTHCRGSSPVLLAGLVGSRGFSVCCSNPTRRSSVALSNQTATGPATLHQFSLLTKGEKCTFEGSSGVHATQGSYHSCKGSGVTRLLQPPVSGSQENRRLEASDRSFFTQQLPSYPILQDGDSRIHQETPSTRPLGHVSRPQRRILSYPNGWLDPQIPEISGFGGYVPVCGSSFRIGHSTKGFHKDCQGDQKDRFKTGNKLFSVYRRLAEPDGVTRVLPLKDPIPSQTYPKIGLDCEFGKIRTDSNPSVRIPGLHVRPHSRNMLPSRTEVSNSVSENISFVHLTSHNPQSSHDTAGTYGLFREDGSFRSSSYETYSGGTQTTVSFTESQIVRPEDRNLWKVNSTSEMVVRTPKCFGDSSSTACNTINIHLHGCLSRGMGRPHGRVDSSGNMVNPRVTSASQSEGTQSSSTGFEVADTHVSRASAHSNHVGQYNSSLVCEQAGWHTVSTTCGSDLENICFLSSQEYSDSSRPCCGIPQCYCRHSVTQRSDPTYRVDTRSAGIQTTVQSDVFTYDRPFCNTLQQQATSVCVANSRSPCNRSRCVPDRLESKVTVCLPAAQYCSQSARESSQVALVGNASDSSILGNKIPLHPTLALQRDSADPVASEAQTSEATTSAHVSQKPSIFEPSCVLAKDCLRLQGYSNEVASRILNPVRKSSQIVYEAKWNCFISYCQDLDIDHLNVSIPQLTDFFEYLFTVKNYQSVTIKGYRSALNLRLSHRLGDLGSNPVLNRLFQSFDRDRPRCSLRVQPWDLSLVLRALTQAPFEPLNTVTLKFLSWKTVFLVALASGRRCSEIHAIRKSKIYHSEGWESMTFRIDHFLCKNQTYNISGEFFNSFTIPSLSRTIDRSCKEDRTLCPVRAVRYYLDRVAKSGKNKSLEALFVPLIETGRELSKASLANWIKNCIKYILSNCTTENAQVHSVRAHDVRAMAASWSLKGGYSLQEIMAACTWRNPTTFSRFYLKDSLESLSGDHRLAPFVAAQSVITSAS